MNTECEVICCRQPLAENSIKMCATHLALGRQRTKVHRQRRKELDREKNERADAYPRLVDTIEQLTQEHRKERAKDLLQINGLSKQLLTLKNTKAELLTLTQQLKAMKIEKRKV